MAKVLTETQLKEWIYEIYQDEYIKILDEKWNKLSNKDKVIVLEMLKTLNPTKAKLINESKWYNTLGDIAGIFDPTGLVDLVNGISYWRQGDKLFAVLSWVSVIPLLGDAIAKPVVGALKVGGTATKAFRTAVVAGDAVKVAETAKAAGGPIAKLVEKSPSWGAKLIEVLKAAIGKIPGVGAPLIRAVEEFIGIFTKASKEIKLPKEVIRGGKIYNVEKALTAAEKEELLKYLAKEQGKMFTAHKGVGNSWLKYMKSDAPLSQKLWAGVPRLFGGNPATRSLMRRSKAYLGFLDWLGLGNFVGPEELAKTMPDAEEKWSEYTQTPEGKQAWESEMGSVQGPTQPSGEDSGISVTDLARQGIVGKSSTDAFSSLIGSLLGKAIV